MYNNKIPIIFAFGEYDWMDKLGAYRLSKFDPVKYKVFSVMFLKELLMGLEEKTKKLDGSQF